MQAKVEALTDVAVTQLPLAPDQREWYERAIALIDPDDIARLTLDLVNIPSPPGYERALAEFLADYLGATGFEAHYQPIDEHSGNAVAYLRGTGDGPTVLLYAPMDTMYAGDPSEDIPWIGPTLPPRHRTPGYSKDGFVVGLGADNPKGMIAIIVAAAKALREANVPMKGDLILGFGAMGMPVQPPPGDGRGAVGMGVGVRHMLHRGVVGDFAVICKPGWTVSWEEVGLSIFRVTVHGSLDGYAGASRRVPPWRNAIVDAATVVQELEAWLPEYQEANTSGLCSPQGAIGAIQGGWTYKPTFLTAAAEIYLDLRVNPRTTPADVRTQFAAAIERIESRHPGMKLTWEMTAAYPGATTDSNNWIVQSAMRAWEHVEGQPHHAVTRSSGQTDASTIRNWGIPTARLGFAPVTLEQVQSLGVDGRRGVTYAPDLVKVVQSYVYTAIDTSTRTRAEVAASGSLGTKS